MTELTPIDGIVFDGENAREVFRWLSERRVRAEIDDHGVLWAGHPVRAVSVNSLLRLEDGELTIGSVRRIVDERAPERHPADVVLSRALERIAELETRVATLEAAVDKPEPTELDKRFTRLEARGLLKPVKGLPCPLCKTDFADCRHSIAEVEGAIRVWRDRQSGKRFGR